jgi:hypothetical protein
VIAVYKLPAIEPLLHAARNHDELPLASSFRNSVKVYTARIAMLVIAALAAGGLGVLGVLLFTVWFYAALLTIGATVLFLLGSESARRERRIDAEHARLRFDWAPSSGGRAEYSAFVAAYGFDVTAQPIGPGYPVEDPQARSNAAAASGRISPRWV